MRTRPGEPPVRPAVRPAGEGPTIVFTFGWGLGSHQGVARHLRELAVHCADQGARPILVFVSSWGYTRFPRPPLPESMQGHEHERALAERGVRVVRVEPHPLHWTLDGLRVRRAVARLIDQEKIDAVLGIYWEAAFLPDLLEKRGVTFGYVDTWQSYRMALSQERRGTGLRGWIRGRVDRRLVVEPYRRAAVHFANSEFTRRELVEVLGVADERIVVTHLGVDESFFSVERARPERIRNLLFFGRLVPEKGIADTIQALGRLAAAGQRDWHLRVCGSGKEEHVRALARELGIADQIELLGQMDDAGLKRELAAAHLAVLPSYSESFGLAIAESQAAGLPVVAYAAGSVPEVVEDGVTAWLAPLKDVQLLSECLANALRDPAATYAAGLAGRERMRTVFGWDKTAAMTLQGLRDLDERPV